MTTTIPGRVRLEDNSGHILVESGSGYLLLEDMPRARTGAGKKSYPGGWVPHKLYNPPRRKINKRKIEALKELYEEAREVIPERLQVGLVPAEVLVQRHVGTTRLPPLAEVDFESLARSIETIRVLIAAVAAAYQAKTQAEYEAARAEEQKRFKRRRDEEALIAILMEI